MATAPWRISGQYYETCSCDFVCPCLPGGMAVKPTKGSCTFAMAFQIERGTYGTVGLDGKFRATQATASAKSSRVSRNFKSVRPAVATFIASLRCTPRQSVNQRSPASHAAPPGRATTTGTAADQQP